MRRAIVGMACMVFLASTVALASGVDDPDDTAGRLDIKYTGAHIEGSRLEFEVEMYENWKNRLFRDTPTHYGSKFPRGHITLRFNTRGDGRAEWVLLAERGGGEWRGHICPAIRRDEENDGGGGICCCGNAKVWRSEPNSIEMSLTPDQILEEGDSSYVWRAHTKLFFGRGCPDTGRRYCKDRALGKLAD